MVSIRLPASISLLKREWVACAPLFSGQARTIIPGGLNALPQASVQLLSPTSVGQGTSTVVLTNPPWWVV